MRLTRLAPLALVLFASFPAYAQSDADRAAARQLAESGIALRKDGKLAEALDKLQRAQQLVDAPTHLLQIAQIQASMGQLVEASETYRKLARFTLEPKAPPAFSKAKDQGAEDLKALEPKIPGLTLVLEPAAKDAVVKIDGVVVPPALIGAERPTNPGDHTIEVTAPGFETATVKVQLSVSQKKTEKIALKQSGGGAVVAPPPPPAGSNNPPPNNPPPPGYEPPPVGAPPPAERPGAYTHDGFYFRIGAGLGIANIDEDLKVSGTTQFSGSASGNGLTLDVGIGGTPGKGFVLGGGIVSTVLSDPTAKASGGGSTTFKGTVSATLGGPMAIFYPNPKSGLHFGAIAGLMTVSLNPDSSNSASTNSNTDDKAGSGFGYSVHGGYDMWVGPQSSLTFLVRYTGGSATYKTTLSGLDVERVDKPSIFGLIVGYTYH